MESQGGGAQPAQQAQPQAPPPAPPPVWYPPPAYYYPPPMPTVQCPRCGALNYYGMEHCNRCMKYLRGEKYSTIGGILILLVGIGEIFLAMLFGAIVGDYIGAGICIIVVLLVGMLAIVGGISAITKKSYPLAILGGICTALSIIGIIGLVLVAISRDDFD